MWFILLAKVADPFSSLNDADIFEMLKGMVCNGLWGEVRGVFSSFLIVATVGQGSHEIKWGPVLHWNFNLWQNESG